MATPDITEVHVRTLQRMHEDGFVITDELRDAQFVVEIVDEAQRHSYHAMADETEVARVLHEIDPAIFDGTADITVALCPGDDEPWQPIVERLHCLVRAMNVPAFTAQ